MEKIIIIPHDFRVAADFHVVSVNPFSLSPRPAEPETLRNL
jgi:hypothetical protein